MTLDQITAAQAETIKFFDSLKAARARMKQEGTTKLSKVRETADVRRRSMDMTRLLAELRRPERYRHES